MSRGDEVAVEQMVRRARADIEAAPSHRLPLMLAVGQEALRGLESLMVDADAADVARVQPLYAAMRSLCAALEQRLAAQAEVDGVRFWYELRHGTKKL